MLKFLNIRWFTIINVRDVRKVTHIGTYYGNVDNNKKTSEAFKKVTKYIKKNRKKLNNSIQIFLSLGTQVR
jgi:predicted RNA-binding protein